MAVYVAEVALAILVKVTLYVDDCHCIVPVFPDKVNSVLLVPEQAVVAPEMDPATEVGLTVIVAAPVVAEAHVPLVTTA